MTTDATITRTPLDAAERPPVSERARELLRRGYAMTAKGVVDGTRAMWPTLAVIAGLFLVGQLAITYGRGLERQDRVERQQDETKAAQVELERSLLRIEGKIDGLQSLSGSMASMEAQLIAIREEQVRLEREHRLLKDTVERRLGMTGGRQ